MTNYTVEVKDLVVRAAKTFAQSFVTFLTLSGFGVGDVTHWAVGVKLLIAAAIAAATVVWNVVIVPLWQPAKVALGFK